jgi:hypothetical protein
MQIERLGTVRRLRLNILGVTPSTAASAVRIGAALLQGLSSCSGACCTQPSASNIIAFELSSEAVGSCARAST